MPSPEVIDLTLSDAEIQPDPIRSDQGPLRLPKQQTSSEQVLQYLPHLASTELEGFFQSFKVLLQPSNELKIIFSTHNRDIFERVLPTPFPQVGDILSEEEDN